MSSWTDLIFWHLIKIHLHLRKEVEENMNHEHYVIGNLGPDSLISQITAILCVQFNICTKS